MSEAAVTPVQHLQRLTGRCNCGAITFAASGPFRDAKACHCKSCRRQSSHFLAATQIDEQDLEVTGADALRWFSVTPEARRGFCGTCGVHLFWQPADSHRISILMGCLDEPTGIHLAEHIHIAEKGDYYDIADDLPQA